MKVLFILIAVLALSVFIPSALATHVSKPILTMDKTAYNVGETVSVKGWVEYNENPTSDVLLDIIFRDSDENEIIRESVRSDPDGNFAYDFELSNDLSAGNYTIEVISQCRDEHRNICTNQSSSMQLLVGRSGAMVLTTDNGSMNVEVTLNRETLEPDQQINFMLRFLDTDSKLLEHVNYSFRILDENDSIIIQSEKNHSHDGEDKQRVIFSRTGTFTLIIDVKGLGLLEPYDETHSGTASSSLTVVPEFPFGVMMVMIAMIGIGIAITRSRNLFPKILN